MFISQPTYDALNKLLADNFQMNSFCDNIAYNLGFKKMICTESIFHEKFAHKFPVFADIISTMMLEFEARPIRYALTENINYYNDNVSMFQDLKIKIQNYRNNILKTIEIADLNNDIEIKIKLEDFLSKFTPYFSQVMTWALRAEQYGLNEMIFDKDFEKFTTI